MELFHGPAATLWILPIFALAIAIEAILYKRAKGKAYPWRESGLSLVIAIGHSVAGAVNHAVIITLLGGLAWNYRFATVPMDQWWAWPLLFILEEFAYYWYHRCAHRIRFMWSTHSVHHSPEELTLASAYRLAWTPALSATWLFFLPLVLLGFHPVAVFGLLAASLTSSGCIRRSFRGWARSNGFSIHRRRIGSITQATTNISIRTSAAS